MTVEKQIKAQFGLLDTIKARHVPPVGSLSLALTELAPAADGTLAVQSDIARLFTTASTDAWHRAIHSFLVSTSLVECSPLWSGVCGYYASHYTVRAFAHLFGCFLLFNKKRLVELSLANGTYNCTFRKKQGSDREHRVYWKRLMNESPIKSDRFFRVNVGDDSEISQRDRANYADHLSSQYKTFLTLDKNATLRRIDRISKIEFTEPPFPHIANFIDLTNVHVIAYHRIVKYRKFLDDLLGSSSRYWSVNRNPSFSKDFIDFQVTENRDLAGTYRR